MHFPYTSHLLNPVRFSTREVTVGDVTIGGAHPIVIQSMTTTPTKDTMATVDQIVRLTAVGCQVVRITTPTLSDLDNIPDIRHKLKERGIRVPLVADVHFQPKIAHRACELFEKVRINPGNFADKKRFEQMTYSDDAYQKELERIWEEAAPFFKKAKQEGCAVRIGTNHGSLSDRIMNRYGDTPLGMVESALEFIRIAESESFFNTVISMKSSNPMVMIQAYRLLVSKMRELNLNYPIHLGVTEAGEGEDGRVKSAVGIGSLLADGIGDTIRVSLTEDPEHEIPVAQELLQLYVPQYQSSDAAKLIPSWDLYNYKRRTSVSVGSVCPVGGNNLVQISVSPDSVIELENMAKAETCPDRWILSPHFLKQNSPDLPADRALCVRVDLAAETNARHIWSHFEELSVRYNPLLVQGNYQSLRKSDAEGSGQKVLWFRIEKLADVALLEHLDLSPADQQMVGFEVRGRRIIPIARALTAILAKKEIQSPIHLAFRALDEESLDTVRLASAVELGALLSDGIGDMISVEAPQLSSQECFSLCLTVLQATRLRMSKADFIACPSCGRTLFDLQDTTAKIKSRTHHLKGVKIAIMGCIVNGPGEMADADFGYVGAGPGKINLFVGKEVVQRHIDESDAADALVELIKDRGRWVEPSA